jgi:hypothetical protein
MAARDVIGRYDTSTSPDGPAIVGDGIVLRGLCPSRNDWLERLSDSAQDGLDIAAHEDEDGDYDDGDEGQDQSVLCEALSFFATETGEMRHGCPSFDDGPGFPISAQWFEQFHKDDKPRGRRRGWPFFLPGGLSPQA